ncbi:hypothetical protein ACB094_01G368900 [Castanea mollissima]
MDLQIQLEVLPAPVENERSEPPRIEHRINKIPYYLYQVNEQAYTPKVISIGPVHHANPNLQPMEKYKRRYLESFIARNDELNLEGLKRTIREMKDGIRYFYEEIDLCRRYDDAELMKMILLDATFILEFFRKTANNQWESEDLMIERQKMIILIDLVLLENQVPFFVLEKLFIVAFPNLSNTALTSLTFECFFLNFQDKQPINMKIVHFTHLMRTFQLPPPERLQGNRIDLVVLSYSASQLHDAGVKLRVNTSSKCLLEIKFERGVLEIPRLELYDDTEALFRNIMAFEVFHSREDIQFTDYCIFMDFLVDTAEDIKVLCDNGILVNCLGEKNSAASFFNRLNSNIYPAGCHEHFAGICEDLNEFSKKRQNRWKATLRHQYFSSPWIAASTIAAIVLLVLTFIQTVYSVK